MQSNNPPRYRIYATLLDAFQNYLDSEIIYERYYANMKEPPYSEEEFVLVQKASLIDRINRVPFRSEATDRGTAFNALIDSLINPTNVDLNIKYSKSQEAYEVEYNEQKFNFKTGLCEEFRDYFQDAISQRKIDGILHSYYGDIELYGYIDELRPFSIHDIKTTNSYQVGKFKKHWQHLVYPYCLRYHGLEIDTFEYNIAVLNGNRYETYTETYVFDAQRDTPILREQCNQLIEFLLDNLQHITDRRIFGGENPAGYIGEAVDHKKLEL